MTPANEEMKARFEAAKNEFYDSERLRDSIGVLSEKTVHAVVKRYLEPDMQKQEIKIGSYHADIFHNGEIVEIQTRNFGTLKEKLAAFLPEYPVTVVYPIPAVKWLRWVDKESGEISARHKSPKKGSPYEVFWELYKIKQFIKHPNFRLKLIFMEMDELRFLDGWSKNKKKGSNRCDRLPGKLVAEYDFTCPQDYLELIPYELPDEFTVKDFSVAAKIHAEIGSIVLTIFMQTGIVERTGKRGRSYLYRVVED